MVNVGRPFRRAFSVSKKNTLANSRGRNRLFSCDRDTLRSIFMNMFSFWLYQKSLAKTRKSWNLGIASEVRHLFRQKLLSWFKTLNNIVLYWKKIKIRSISGWIDPWVLLVIFNFRYLRYSNYLFWWSSGLTKSLKSHNQLWRVTFNISGVIKHQGSFSAWNTPDWNDRISD